MPRVAAVGAPPEALWGVLVLTERLPELLDAKALQDELGVKRGAAEKIMSALPIVTLPGLRKVYVRRADVQRHLDEHTLTPEQRGVRELRWTEQESRSRVVTQMTTTSGGARMTKANDLKRVERNARQLVQVEEAARRKRDDSIRAARENGASLREIARAAGLTHARIIAILREEAGDGR